MSESRPHALPAGRRIEEYEIVRVLGAGGFGITYLAFDHSLNGPVAIKEYFPADIAARTGGWRVDDLIERPWRTKTAGVASQASDWHVAAATPEQADIFTWGLDRFIYEARSLHSFRHPNVVRAQRCIQACGTAYIVMEYVEGESLQAVLDTHGRLSATEWRCWLDPLLDGLAHVHEHGYLHRDIKPANIVIRAADGAPVLIDFGAARLAARERTHTQVLTPGYAPIEQHSSERVQGPPTDIYSLAAVSYRTLTGKPLPSAPDRVLDDDYEPLADCIAGADRQWLGAIDQGLALRPEHRPQTISAWIAILHAADSTAVAYADAGAAETGNSGRTGGRIGSPLRTVEHDSPAPRRSTQGLKRLWWLAAVLVLFVARELPEFVARQGRRVATIVDDAAPLIVHGVARGVAQGLASNSDDGVKTGGDPSTISSPPAPTQSTPIRGSSPQATEAALGLDWAGRQVIQRGLRANGFDPGAVDGLFGPAPRTALRAWQESQGRAATGYLDKRQSTELRVAGRRSGDSALRRSSKSIVRELDSLVSEVPGGNRAPVWPHNPAAARSTVERLCNARGLLNGPAAHSRCVEEAKRYRPDFRGLSAADRSTIELMCATELLNGPAAYSRCVEEAKRYRPDFRGLSAADRSTIELMCATELLNGPAAYSRCVMEANRTSGGKQRSTCSRIR